MPAPANSIEEWARVALTGNPDASAPTNAQLLPFVAAETARLYQAYPCIGPDPLTELTEQADVDAFAEALGYAVAARFLGTAAGQSLPGVSGGVTKVKIGPVERSSGGSSGVSLKDLKASLTGAMFRVSCVALALAKRNANAPGMATLAGRRRALGTPTSIEGTLLAGTAGEADPNV